MPIPTLAVYVAQQQRAMRVTTNKPSQSTDDGVFVSFWTDAPEGGVIPSAAVACSSATQGAIPYNPAASARFFGAQTSHHISGGTNAGHTLILFDRLSHQGGLSGTLTSVQTTNLPTAPLTRSVGGEGVFACAECIQSGGTTRTLTVSYTNSTGVAGRVGICRVGGGAGRQIRIMTLQDGDTGVRSIESVQLDASTGVAGGFGMVLFRPLAILPRPSEGRRFSVYDALLNLGANLFALEQSACLWIFQRSGVTVTSQWEAMLLFGEDA
jgi:hypothetical protein